MNCNHKKTPCNECENGCEPVFGACVTYTGDTTEFLHIPKGLNLDSIVQGLDATIENLQAQIDETSGSIAISNTNTISLTGGSIDTPLQAYVKISTASNNALTVDSTGLFVAPPSGGTQNLQAVTTLGNSSTKPILITGNDSTPGPGLYLGKNYIRSKGTGFAFDSLTITGSDVTVAAETNTLLLLAMGGSILVPSTGLPIRLSSSLGIELLSTTAVPATFNTRVKGLEGTEANDFVTLSQLDDIESGEPLWIGSYDEQVIATNGVINNLAITSNLLRFTGTGVVLTGIATQTTRAKQIVLINSTGVDINLQHLSGASTTANQLFILGNGLVAGDNVTLANGAAVTLVYSNGKWRTSDWFGDGYHPNLIGTGTRVIEVLPSGKEIATDSFDYEYFRPDITTNQTDSQLNVLYPGVYRGTTVYCKNITTGGMAFKKDDDVLNTWIRIPFIV